MPFPWSPFDFGPFDGGDVPPEPPYVAPPVDLLSILAPTEPDLGRLVWVSLFSDARAHDDDVLPIGSDRRGWWADTYNAPDAFGSRLWLLERAVVTQDALNRAHDYAVEALAWMVADGLAAAVDVVAERMGSDNAAAGIALTVTVTRGDQTPQQVYRFGNIWGEIDG